VRNTTWRIVLASVFSLHLLAGCGGERMERGLAEGPEEAVPAEAKELGMTEAERREQETREEEEKEAKIFEAEQER